MKYSKDYATALERQLNKPIDIADDVAANQKIDGLLMMAKRIRAFIESGEAHPSLINYADKFENKAVSTRADVWKQIARGWFSKSMRHTAFIG